MGIGGMGIWQLLIILVIVLLLFGTKRLKGLGSDLGGAIKGFKSAMTDSDKKSEEESEPTEEELKKVAGEDVEPTPSEQATKKENSESKS